MFELKTIELKNFFSFGRNPTTIDFTQGKTWLLHGMNGSGKSVLGPEFLHFALFGKPYRDAKVPDVVNRVNKEECVVKICFRNNGNEYVIERGVKPRILNVTCNGSTVQENVSKRDFQEVIDDIIGIPYNVFSQLTIIDNTFYTPFMDLDAKDRRLIIDKIFGLDKISLMLERGREFKIKIGNKIVESKGKVEVTKEKIKLNEQYALAALEKEISDKQEDIVRIDKELKDIEIRRAELLIELTDSEVAEGTAGKELESLEEQIKTLAKAERIHEQKIIDLERHEKLIRAGKCKECGHVFENVHEELEKITKDKAEENKKLSDLQTVELLPLEERKKLCGSELTTVRQTIDKIKTEKTLLTKHEGKLQTQKEDEQKELETLANKKMEGVIDTTALQEELKVAQERLIQDTYMHTHITECEKVLSDGGVRAYIIKKFLPTFNAALKKYLAQMDAGFSFTFDAEFNDVTDERFRNSFAYGNLSTGQRARCNFAIIFALMEFVEKRNNIKTDFIILDEALENGLDQDGKMAILSILKGINKRLIVISHDSKLQELFEKKIHVQMQGSFSRVDVT